MTIFKACDIRGRYGADLTDTVAEKLGRAVGTRLAGQVVVVGGDVRLSTPPLKAALIRGLTATGCHVLDAGILPTPALHFAKGRLGAAGSVMVTASHNPAPDNGFKLMFGDRPPSEETLQAIRREMAAGRFAQGEGAVSEVDILPEYEAFIAQRFLGGELRLVVDCGNGCQSLVAPAALSRIGYRVEPLFCEPDGRFPNRPPNPAVAHNLQALSERVVAAGADLGLAFDGDGDRVVFVDAQGQAAASDRVAVLMARRLLAQHGPADVIYDIKSSSALAEGVRAAGGTPIMERSGHAFIKATLLERGALFGAEISGHFFFREVGGDDALYAACLLLEILRSEGRALSAILAGVPRYPITPDIRLPCTARQAGAILKALQQAFAGQPITLLDGVRVDFGDGWALARRSVTEPLITLRFEARTPARLAEIQELVREKVPALAEIWG